MPLNRAATDKQPRSVVWVLCATYALALALRLYRLDGQSLWNDEGTSVALASRSLATITRDASHDIHPPLYYYLLHVWVSVLDDSVPSVRALSALLGAATIPVIYALGKRLFDRRTAALAAICATISPFLIYYSQEVRMYALVTLLGALSFWLFLCWLDVLLPAANICHMEQSEASHHPEHGFLRFMQNGKARCWLYVAATTLMMYTHYFAFALVVAQNGLFLLRWATRPRFSWRPILSWVVAQIAVVALFAPWLWVVWQQLRAWPAVSEPFGLLSLLRRVLHVFGVGLSLEGLWWSSGFAGTVGIGWLAWLLRALRRAEGAAWWPAAVAWAYWLMPMAILYLLSRQRPMYNPKFLLLAAPGFALVLGRSLSPAGLRRWPAAIWCVAALGFVLLASALSLRNYYHDPRYARDDYRGIARYIEAVESEQDAVLINAPGQYETFIYYYRGRSPIYPLPRQRPIDTLVTESDLCEMIAGRRHIYAILWATDESDPERFIENWLDQHTYKASDVWYGNVRLVIYAVPQGLASDVPRVELDVTFGNRIALRGYTLLTPEVRAGEILQLSFFWEALAPIQTRYKVFIHVLDAHEHIVGQRDAEPGGGFALTNTWTVGEQLVDNHGVLILPATPPGSYRIALGMYGLDDGQRLPIRSDGQRKQSFREIGDRLFLDTLTVRRPAAPPPKAALGMQKELSWAAGPLELWGYNLAKLGQEHLPDAPIHAGDALHLTLFWHVQERPAKDLELLIQLLDAKSQVRLVRRAAPVEGDYPTCAWSAGEVVRDQHVLFLPADLGPGSYKLLLEVREADTKAEVAPSRLLQKIAIRSP